MAEAGNALGPDLMMGGLSVSLPMGPENGPLRVMGTVVNAGAQAAGASEVALFLSDDPILDPDDLLLEVVALAGIAPGHLIDFSQQLVLPALPPSGRPAYLLADVDFANDVSEAQEGNNLGFVGLPELDASLPLGPTTNIEAFVLVLRADSAIAGTEDMPAYWRVAEDLPNTLYLEAARDLTAAGMGGFTTVQMADAQALAALERGDVAAALLPRDSASLDPLGDGYAVFEIPNDPGALRPFDPDIALVTAPVQGGVLTSTGADEVLLGGEGVDTAGYEGPQSSFTLTLTPSTMSMLDRRADGQGRDWLVSVERLRFDDPGGEGPPTDLNLAIFSGPTGLTEEEFGAITELYIAYFNRAPDALGLYYWGTEYSNGFTIQQIATSFFAQPETRATYAHVLDAQGNLVNTDAFVTAVYANVLGRTPDPEGFAYWVNELDHNPAITAPIFILSVIGGAKFPSNPTPQTQADQAYLLNKVNIGAYYSAIKGISDTQHARTVMSLFDGTDESVSAAKSAIDSLYQEAMDPDAGAFLFQLVGVLDDPFAGV